MAQIGAAGATLVKSWEEFDPNSGTVYCQQFEGNQASIAGLYTAFRGAGYRCKTDHDGPCYTLETRTGTVPAGQTETPIDKWNLDIDFVQESIWSNAKVIKAAADTAAASGGIATADDFIAHWQAVIQAEKDHATTVDASEFPAPLDAIYATIVRGQDAFETERPVLTRVRTISATYAGQVVLDAVPKVYTTAKLVSTFGIPASIATRLPSDPAYTPPHAVWAWKKRKDTSEFILSLNKVQEVRDWVFAAWGTLTYDVLT